MSYRLTESFTFEAKAKAADLKSEIAKMGKPLMGIFSPLAAVVKPAKNLLAA